jgi:pimeloyl-ACP methyl ester carboxylesterase
MTQRFYVELPWGQMHGVRMGDGPAVALLHPSPLSVTFLAPQATALATAGFTAIAWDTPGYGGSDPLMPVPDDLDAYADAVITAMAALGHQRFHLYGAATGGQIALALARRAPQRVHRLVLESIGHIPAETRATWADAYFSRWTPRDDGGHLAQLWAIAAAQATRFPWHLGGAPRRPAPPAAAIHAMVIGFLRAGPDYDRAYRLAFAAEDAASFTGLTTPTSLIDWADGMLQPELHALIAQGLPDCVRVVEAASGLPARLNAVVAAFHTAGH